MTRFFLLFFLIYARTVECQRCANDLKIYVGTPVAKYRIIKCGGDGGWLILVIRKTPIAHP